MDNMQIYENVRNVPKEAQKEITGGRLKGFTDINPMWRIKKLTEEFGPVGIGWYYDIVEKQIIDGGVKKDVTEKIATVDINLYIKVNDEWSKPISGTGGASFIAGEKYGAYTSDECFKMALTDAISVVCKALGFAADVYWDKDRSKYTQSEKEPDKPKTNKKTPKKVKEITAKKLIDIAKEKGYDEKNILNIYNSQTKSNLADVELIPVNWKKKLYDIYFKLDKNGGK